MPIVKNASGGVYLVAYDTTLTPTSGKAGDAANITGFWSKDGGAQTTGFTTANPTEIGGGIYWQPLTAAETNGDHLAYRWVSATSGVVIDPNLVDTVSGSLSVDASGRVDVGKILGTASQGAAGYVGVDWGAVTNKTTTNALTGTTISSSQVVASVTGSVGNVTGSVGSVASGGITSSSFAAGAINAAAIAADAIGASELATDAVTEIAGGILNAVASSYNTATTIGAKINLISAGGGSTDANIISVNGTTFGGVNVPAILADGVAHGGTQGSSTATLALQSGRITNPSGRGLFVEGTTRAVEFSGTGASGIGLRLTTSATGAFGSALVLAAGERCPAVTIYGASVEGAPVISIDATADNAGFDGGPAIQIRTGDGHGIDILAGGTGKHGILSTGGTDGDGFHGVGAGTGVGFRSTPDAVGFDGGTADVNVVSLSAPALAQFFTVDTGERYAAPYSDAVAGSVVGEIVGNVGLDIETVVLAVDSQLSDTHGSGAWGGGGGLTQADVRTAIGMAAPNLDTQLAAIKSDTGSIISTLTTMTSTLTTIASYVDTEVATILATVNSIAGDVTTIMGQPLTAAEIRAAVGLDTNNLDTQLGDLPTAAEIADKLLGRNLEGGSDSGRTVRQALYFLRNKWAIVGGVLTVCDTSDSPSWTAVVTASGATPVTGIDP